MKEDEILNVYGKDDEWLLVSNPEVDGRVGYVPGNYVTEVRFSLSVYRFCPTLLAYRRVRMGRRPLLLQRRWHYR